MARAKKQIVVAATTEVPAITIRNGTGPIAAGQQRQVAKSFWFNGEGWYLFTDGTAAPDVFFSKVK